jgi:hypothetical protein
MLSSGVGLLQKGMGVAEAGGVISADLVAVLLAVSGESPRVLTVSDGAALPSGPFALDHRSLQSGLRLWVERQTAQPMGYLEQLYTFADRDRTDRPQHRVISISYLGLMREAPVRLAEHSGWRDWYAYFPWEDHRGGRPAALDGTIAPLLRDWAATAPSGAEQRERGQRVGLAFGLDGFPWNDELVLQRYELLYEARLVGEALRGRSPGAPAAVTGSAMIADHRRILATGAARLRAKIKYRPVVFELMPESFTLLQLQRCVEAVAGRVVHKQNFRRLIEQQELVEETGETATATGGRPAKLFRFRQAVLAERAVGGTKLPLIRA